MYDAAGPIEIGGILVDFGLGTAVLFLLLDSTNNCSSDDTSTVVAVLSSYAFRRNGHRLYTRRVRVGSRWSHRNRRYLGRIRSGHQPIIVLWDDTSTDCAHWFARNTQSSLQYDHLLNVQQSTILFDLIGLLLLPCTLYLCRTTFHFVGYVLRVVSAKESYCCLHLVHLLQHN